METNVTINIVELASELADRKITQLQNDSLKKDSLNPLFPNGIVKEDEETETIMYTEEAQDVFNEWYDYFYDLILTTKV